MRPHLFAALSLLTGAAAGSPALAAAQVPPIPPSAYVATEEPINIPMNLALKVGKQIWLNETGGKAVDIAYWGRLEDFASLGIGHFLWFADRPEPYEESFPPMIEFLRKNRSALTVPIPGWLDHTPVPHCPWNNKKEFDAASNDPRMIELRAFLNGDFGAQTLFLVQRMKESLQKIEAATPDATERTHVRAQFYRVVHSSPDLYPLIDYVNFKGEGIEPKETTVDPRTKQRVGWGLKQVLLDMKGMQEGPAALKEYSESAQKMLKRRIQNNPVLKPNESNWMGRCASYQRPLP